MIVFSSSRSDRAYVFNRNSWFETHTAPRTDRVKSDKNDSPTDVSVVYRVLDRVYKPRSDWLRTKSTGNRNRSLNSPAVVNRFLPSAASFSFAVVVTVERCKITWCTVLNYNARRLCSAVRYRIQHKLRHVLAVISLLLLCVCVCFRRADKSIMTFEMNART